jgi:predicted dehydrogenase
MSSTALHERTRVVVLGTGAMGRLHVRVFSQLGERFQVAGVFDANRSVAEDVARSAGVHSFTREADAIAEAELVVVATPISAHAVTVKRALEAGKSVLVEKPLCSRADEASVLVRTARAAALASDSGSPEPKPVPRLFVGHSERYNPVIRALRRLIVPSTIRGIEVRRIATPLARPREHGVILSLAVHDLDLAGYLTAGAIELVEATGSAEARARLVLACASGATARIWADCTAEARERSIEVTTAHQSWTGDLLAQRLVRRERGGGLAREVPLDSVEPLVAQALAVADALQQGRAVDVASGVDGAKAVVVAERVVQWLGDARREVVSAAS